MITAMLSCVSWNSTSKRNCISWEKWKDDSLGCNGYRKQHQGDLINAKRELLGIDTTTLKEKIGFPNVTFGRTDSTISYGYYLEPGNQCSGVHSDSSSTNYYRIVVTRGVVTKASAVIE